MLEQLSIFDFISPKEKVSIFDENGVMRCSDITPIKFESYVYKRSDCSGGSDWDYLTGQYGRDKSIFQIYGYIALLPENIVYVKNFYYYAFAYKCKSAEEAYKLYEKELKTIKEHENKKIDAQVPMKDLYLVNSTGAYSEKEYADKTNYGFAYAG